MTVLFCIILHEVLDYFFEELRRFGLLIARLFAIFAEFLARKQKTNFQSTELESSENLADVNTSYKFCGT